MSNTVKISLEAKDLSHVTERISSVYRAYEQISMSASSGPRTPTTISQPRTESVLLTRFSLQEWMLASSVTNLLDALQTYPDILLLDSESRTMKPSQILVARASDLVSAVRTLGKACLDAVKVEGHMSVVEKDIRAMRSKMHAATAATVDNLKKSLLSFDSVDDDSTVKMELFMHLIEVSTLAKSLLDYSSVQEKLIRNRFSSETTLSTLRGDTDSSALSSPSRGPRPTIEPDGEGFAIFLGPNAMRPKVRECAACHTDVRPNNHIVSYLTDVYHETCLRCASCEAPVYGGSFLTKNGQPLCIDCSPLCAVCEDPIKFDCFLALDKAYHKTCFKCVDCQDPIQVPDDKFYRMSKGPCCTSCISKPSQMVFQKVWSPSMDTRFSMFLRDDDRKLLGLDEPSEAAKELVAIVALPDLPPTPPPRSRLPVKATVDEKNGAPKAPPRKGSVTVSSGNSPVIPGVIMIADLIASNAYNRPGPASTHNTTLLEEDDEKSESLVRRLFGVSKTEEKSKADEKNITAYFEDSNQSSSSLTLSALKSLPEILASEIGRAHLTSFCTECQSVQFLYFWMDVEQYRLLDFSDRSTAVCARKIFDRYIKTGAEMSIEVSQDSYDAIMTHVQGPVVSPVAFDAVQRQCYEEMETRILPVFLVSRQGGLYLQEAAVEQQERSSPSIPPYAGKTPSPDMLLKNPNFVMQLVIINFEKRFKPEKHYMYQLLVRRARDITADSLLPCSVKHLSDASDKFCPLVYRNYQELHELHTALTLFLPALANRLPSLPSRSLSIFQRHRGGTKDRCKEINEYLVALLEVSPLVTNSIIMKKFLEPSQEDLENFDFSRKMNVWYGMMNDAF